MEVKEQIQGFLQKHKMQIWVFTITFFCGYFIHFYVFTNKFFNYFEMNNILTGMSFYKGDTVEQGKWFIPILSSVSTIYSMPAVNGMIGIIFLSVFNLLVCDLLKIKGRFFGVLTGLVIMTYPSVASYFSYGVNTDVLTIAPCIGVFSIWLIEKGRQEENKKRGLCYITVGTSLIGLTIGSYQPFFAIVIAAVYGLIFVDALQNNLEWKEIWKKIFFYAVILIVGFVIYYVGLKLVCAITGVQVGDYHGANEMTSFTVKGIAKGFVYTYFYFLYYFFSIEYSNYKILIIANVILAVILAALVVKYIAIRQEKNQKNTAMIVLLFILLPLGTNAAPFLMADRVGNGVDRYMMFSILFVYFIVIKLASDFPWKVSLKKKCNQIEQWLFIVSAITVVISGAYMCNQAYYRMECMTNQENAYLTRVVARMENTEGWNGDIPVYIANCRSVFNNNYDVDIPQFDNLTRVDGTELKPWYNRSAIAKYMRVYLHFPVNEATETQIKQVEQTNAYKKMESFPAESSVQIIDGVMVVKFNEVAE